MHAPLLSVRDLNTSFRSSRGILWAVRHADLDLARGERVGVVGESGCGKTMLALSLMGLVPKPQGEVRAREMRLSGRDLTALTKRQWRSVRGEHMAMVFQEPMSALNPVLRVGAQISEAIRAHRPMRRKGARQRALELLESVDVPQPRRVLDAFPHELSGGLRQRAIIAMALACDPQLILADEPTTALDASVQGRILDLMSSQAAERGAALLLITHDLAVVAKACDRVLVMYAGRVVESAPRAELFQAPLHPYAQGLMASLPKARQGARQRLRTVPGAVPDLARLPQGCAFHPRCSHAWGRCRDQAPPLFTASTGREVRCWLHESASGTQHQTKGPLS